MEYNPLGPLVEERRASLNILHATLGEKKQTLAWCLAFDPAHTAERAASEEESIGLLERCLTDLDEILNGRTERLIQLRRACRLGWDVTYWISAQRHAAKNQLRQEQQSIEKAEGDQRRLLSAKTESLSRLTDLRASIQRYSAIDRDALERSISALEDQIGQQAPELHKLEAYQRDADRMLQTPLQAFKAKSQHLEKLKNQRRQAEEYLRQLGDAHGNSYERRQVHERCERDLGDGSPQRVIKKVNRDLPGVARTVEKLERRLEQISKRAMLRLQVENIVIDGSNLCYDGDRIVGLFPLKALCTRLIKDYAVTVFFDASVRSRLGGLSNEAIRQRLPNVQVYFVEAPEGADETLLEAAKDPRTYVLSNDRFSEFQDKAAVRERRLITHSILEGRILVQDLSIDVSFRSTESKANDVER
ncbi:hypothetical protein SAMN05660916_02336 [Arthrobacter sp. 31Cvi3.1E]|nr:hypothetical protein SAMN05660916_02336 [Arthrobacter sp. 31Cvi3.1E]